MKYQVIKRLKTKSKLLLMANTLQEAKQYLNDLGAKFTEISYIGQFPVYTDNKHTFSIQGAVMFDNGSYIVCSLDKEDLQTF